MRKFQYTVTIELDDQFLETYLQEQPDVVQANGFKEVAPENFVSVFAERLPDPINAALREGLVDAGDSKVETIFVGECK